MLEIMKDSHVGAFGVLAIVMLLLSQTVLLSVVPLGSLLLFPLVGRNAALLVASTNEYARPSGLGSIFVNAASKAQFLWGSALYLLAAVLMFGMGWTTIMLAIVYLICMLKVYWLLSSMSRKLGGVTGDLIGFAIEVSQVIFLLLVYVASVINI
jgi:adenosylcobinamide-GDP ribazoletransferase